MFIGKHKYREKKSDLDLHCVKEASNIFQQMTKAFSGYTVTVFMRGANNLLTLYQINRT